MSNLQHDFYQAQQIDYVQPIRHLNQMNDDLLELKDIVKCYTDQIYSSKVNCFTIEMRLFDVTD
jgi:hypothetical protein